MCYCSDENRLGQLKDVEITDFEYPIMPKSPEDAELTDHGYLPLKIRHSLDGWRTARRRVRAEGSLNASALGHGPEDRVVGASVRGLSAREVPSMLWRVPMAASIGQ